MTKPLTDEQKEQFQALINRRYPYQLALMSGQFQGTDVAYIVEVNELPSGMVDLLPIAIFIDEDFREKFGDQMTDASGDSPQKHEDS